MRIREILSEDSDSAGSPGAKHKASGKLNPIHKSAIKNMNTFPELPGWYYDMYRFGVNMAGSPNPEHPMDSASANANHLNVYAYTDQDQAIINKSAKNLGLTAKNLTGPKSMETDSTHKVSPVAKPKRNKYGV